MITKEFILDILNSSYKWELIEEYKSISNEHFELMDDIYNQTIVAKIKYEIPESIRLSLTVIYQMLSLILREYEGTDHVHNYTLDSKFINLAPMYEWFDQKYPKVPKYNVFSPEFILEFMRDSNRFKVQSFFLSIAQLAWYFNDYLWPSVESKEIFNDRCADLILEYINDGNTLVILDYLIKCAR